MTKPPTKQVGDQPPELVTRKGYVWPDTPDITYPRVSTLLAEANKPALVGWAAKETAHAAIYEREQWQNLTEEDALKHLKNARFRSSTKAANKGTNVHAHIPNIEGLTGKHLTNALDQYQPPTGETEQYVHQAINWMKHNLTEVKHQEITVYTPPDQPHGPYAGTVDLLGIDRTGDWCLVDWKSGKGLYPETGLQLAAYAMSEWLALYQPQLGTYHKGKMPKITKLYGIHLQPDHATEYTWHWPNERLQNGVTALQHLHTFTQTQPFYATKRKFELT